MTHKLSMSKLELEKKLKLAYGIISLFFELSKKSREREKKGWILRNLEFYFFDTPSFVIFVCFYLKFEDL